MKENIFFFILITEFYGSREVPSYWTNFQIDLFFWKIVLYFSNRFISFQSISVFQISISNRFIFFKSIFIFQVDLYYSNPTFKSVYIFQIHLCFLNRFKFFKQTLLTCFFFPKGLISSKSFSIFQSKIQIGLYISKQLNNFQINLYFPRQLNSHFKFSNRFIDYKIVEVL